MKITTMITNIQELNKTWNQLCITVTIVAKKNIPRTKVGPKTYYAFLAKATKLHSALTEINKTLRNLKNNKEDTTNIEDINK
ncbi:6056_t:CDS:1, partial [Ambispora leptoticha]